MHTPGFADDLDTGVCQAWNKRVTSCIDAGTRNLAGLPRGCFVHPVTDELPHRATVDWTGFPSRPAECLTRARALELVDWTSSHGPGRVRRFQEEYVEWRVVRDEIGITRIEFTTELAEYWRVLAAYGPRRTVELISQFAGRSIDAAAVYPGCDPFASTTSPQQREAAFAAAMLADEHSSPCNDGRAAIICMLQRTNTLEALVQLVLVATQARVVRDSTTTRLRCPTCEEVIPLMDGAAQAGRLSDPVLVERLGRLAYEGRLVGLDDPIGVYIQAVEHERLKMPDGETVPTDWFRFDRGTGSSQSSDQPARWQRLTIAPPTGSGLRVSDLRDAATEEPIRYGGQVADLVQVAVILRLSGADEKQPDRSTPIQLPPPPSDPHDCTQLQEQFAACLASRQ